MDGTFTMVLVMNQFSSTGLESSVLLEVMSFRWEGCPQVQGSMEDERVGSEQHGVESVSILFPQPVTGMTREEKVITAWVMGEHWEHRNGGLVVSWEQFYRMFCKGKWLNKMVKCGQRNLIVFASPMSFTSADLLYDKIPPFSIELYHRLLLLYISGWLQAEVYKLLP